MYYTMKNACTCILFSMSLENDFLAPFMAYKCAVYDYKKEDNAN